MEFISYFFRIEAPLSASRLNPHRSIPPKFNPDETGLIPIGWSSDSIGQARLNRLRIQQGKYFIGQAGQAEFT